MCGPYKYATDPEILLAQEFKNELGVDINPQALRTFVRAKWSRISVLAHSIHETAGEAQKQSSSQ